MSDISCSYIHLKLMEDYVSHYVVIELTSIGEYEIYVFNFFYCVYLRSWKKSND